MLWADWVRVRCCAAARTPAGRDWSCLCPWRSCPVGAEARHSAALAHGQSSQEAGRRAWLGQMWKFPSNLTSNAFRGGTDFGDEAGAVNGWGWGGV